MIEDIYNYLPLSEMLLSSGMPTAGQMSDISRSGVELVINLAMPDAPRALPDEARLVTSLGMKYIGIPVEWDKPTKKNLKDFMEAMDANQGTRILVHCQANYRATCFIALYRILRLGWDQDKAFRDLLQIWYPEDYPVWKKFIAENLIKKQ
jgi:protein tyrosine phosphatase (PTP) superfamily phosphohydrolase (DUF442 family)